MADTPTGAIPRYFICQDGSAYPNPDGWWCKFADVDAILTAQAQEIERLKEHAANLADAAFHYQTCNVCKNEGEDSCQSGLWFSAFLRGETDGETDGAALHTEAPDGQA